MVMHICRRKLADKVFFWVAIVFLIYVLPHEVASRKVQIHEKNSKLEDRNGNIKVTRYQDNEVFDCVDIYKQPAFDHPLLKDHIIQMKPTSYPMKNEAHQILQGESTLSLPIKIVDCPEGTIPILRTSESVTKSSQSVTTSFSQIEQFNQSLVEFTSPDEHEYAVVTIMEANAYTGAQSKFNVWVPTVEDNEFSLSQMWVAGGDGANVNTVEAGWQVYGNESPRRARIFTYWTADSYASTGCYNLRCPGFVQVNQQYPLGSAIEPVSSYNGTQSTVEIIIHKDPSNGNWWLHMNSIDMGYWPNSLFTSLKDRANRITWGGEIINDKREGHHTTTQMGSGHFSSELLGKSAFVSNLMYVDGSNEQKDPGSLIPYVTNSKCYDVSNWRDSVRGVHIYYGGPGFSDQCP